MKYLLFILVSFNLQAQRIASARISSAQVYRTFNSEYQALIDKGTALIYTLPSVGQQLKQNSLCTCLKNNIGTPLATYFDLIYIFATDGSSDFATLNLVHPSSFQASKVNSPTFTINIGFNGDAASTYLDSNFAYGTNGVAYTQNSGHRSAYVYATGGTFITIDGTATTTDNAMQNGQALLQRINQSGNNAVNLELSGANAIAGIDRSSSTAIKGYSFRRNSITSATTTSSTSGNTLTETIFRRASTFGGMTISFYSMGSHLTDAQWSNLNICVTNYVNSL